MVIWTSLQACGVVLPFAISTSICRSSVTICSGLYLLIDMTGLPPQVNSLSFHLVQKSPVRSAAAADADRRIHPGVPGDSGGSAIGKLRSNRDAGGRDVVARNPGEHALGQRSGIRGEGTAEVAGECGDRNVVHRARKPLGERVL